ncbi:MAG: hypothetical protein WA432_02335 [Candidatus Babeliaceae bacterium]
MKKHLITISILSIFINIHPVLKVLLADADTLKNRLHKKGFYCFVRETGIHKQLEKKLVTPKTIVSIVQTALKQWDQVFNNSTNPWLKQKREWEILNTILCDVPQARKRLRLPKENQFNHY